MAINWFPGHMKKAIREIKKALKRVDVILEVLDARLPHSSENPLVADLRGSKPALKILNKSDLADPEVNKAWLVALQRRPGTRAVLHERSRSARKLLVQARNLLPPERNKSRPVTAMIVGVPNVGKSTLINALAGKQVARTSNKPAVTRQQQRLEVADNFVLLDTPGFLWPRLHPADCGFRLAASGAVSEAAYDTVALASWMAAWLVRDYPEALRARYKLSELPSEPQAVLEAIAGRRGCIRKGGVVDWDGVAQLLIREFRNGKLGRLSLERPASTQD